MIFSTPMVAALLNTKPDSWPAQPVNPARAFKFQTRRLTCAHVIGRIVNVCEAWGYYPGSLAKENRFLYKTGPDYPPGWAANRGSIKDFVNWRSARYIVREAVRMRIKIMEIRKQRLWDITAPEVKAEGLSQFDHRWGIPDLEGKATNKDSGWSWAEWSERPVDAYRHLWKKIHGREHPWDSNPEVYVISFMRAL